MSSRRLDSLSSRDLLNALSPQSVVVVPLGATEQHGPHLPVNTDSVIAEATAAAGVERAANAGVDAWLLPILSYTKSNEHAHFPGTFSLTAATLMATLDELGRALAATPARKIVFLNGHGGNSALVAMMNRELRLNHGLQTFLTHPGVPPDQGGTSAPSELGMGVHGGMDETSLMLHLAPVTVQMNRATRNIPEAMAVNRYVRFGGPVAFGWLSDDFGPDGHIGDPMGATAEQGEILFNGATRVFAEALAEIAQFRFGQP